jgi:DNA polymerase-3 subunit epsilon
VPRETFDRSDADPPLIGIVLDCETTGLDPTLDEIIELAMLRFSFTPDGSILRILASFDELEQPRLPIPPEITTLTGITNDMVEGRTIDANDVEAFVADAAIVVAHNARFDRAFAENAFVVFREMEWACSVDQIPWREHGYEGTKLPYLLAHHGFFTNAHRAGDDCRALLHVLASPFIPQGKSAFSVLLRNAKEETIRIHAVALRTSRKTLSRSGVIVGPMGRTGRGGRGGEMSRRRNMTAKWNFFAPMFSMGGSSACRRRRSRLASDTP